MNVKKKGDMAPAAHMSKRVDKAHSAAAHMSKSVDQAHSTTSSVF